jgi:sulfur relay (sulfurtransferase) DsrC/TusE family protein
MKAISIFFLFIGIILVIQAYYKNMTICPEQETIIKYVPRSIYEDQMNDEQKLTEFYKVMFDGSEKQKTDNPNPVPNN